MTGCTLAFGDYTRRALSHADQVGRVRACELPRVSWSPRSCDQAVCGTSSSRARYACSYSSGGT
jgi:hypothetical protein